MTFGLHPVVLTALISTVFAVVVIAAAFQVKSAAGRVLLGVMAVVLLLPAGYIGLAMNPWLTDARFRAYRSFYKGIETGMTRAQVKALVGRHYPAGWPRGTPTIMEDTPARLGFFMNPETSTEPNCEGIFLEMRGDRVTAISYSAD